MYTDPGNLQELCRHHHDMTTASMDRKRLEKEKGPLQSPRKKVKRKVVDSEAKENVSKLRSDFTKSKLLLTKRGVWNNLGDRPSKVQNFLKGSMKFKGTKLESLYPPDHWLFDSNKYDERTCKEFEGSGWCWSKYGGARSRGTPQPHYKSPPSKNSKML